MARGTASGPNEDPRWDGQDSLSLPDRPAHPDPSRVAESSVDEAPLHGIHGFVEAKHGIRSEAVVAAERAQLAKAEADALEAERVGAQARADAGGDDAKRHQARVKQIDARLKDLDTSDVDDDLKGGAAVAVAVQEGAVVPSIEAAPKVEDSTEGKRTDSLPGNAPTVEAKK